MAQELATTFQPHYYFETFNLARKGFTNKEIAEQLQPPVKFTAFLAWTRKDPNFKAAIERGKQEAGLLETAKTLDDTLQEQAEGLSSTQMAFLMAYAKCGGLTTAAQSIGVSRQNHYQWIEEKEDYQTAFETAHKIFQESLVRAAVERGRDGKRTYKFYKGQPIMVPCDQSDPDAVEVEDQNGNMVWAKHYYELNYSDRLLERVLEAYVPEFEPKGSQTNVNVGGPTFVMDSLLERVEAARASRLTKEDVIDTVAKRIEQHTKGTAE